MNIKNYETFIINKARDLEVSLFNYFFLNEGKMDCINALTLYLNEDGGVSNIDPDNLNNTSTLASSIYFLDVVTKLKYNNTEVYFNDILNDLTKYLIKQKEFTYFHKTNVSKPCSILFKTNDYKFELEAITYAYIIYYSTNKSSKIVYKEKLDKLIKQYLELEDVNFNQLFYFKKIEYLFNNELLKNKIINDVNNIKDFNLHKLIFDKNDYLKNNDIFKQHKQYLLNNQNSIGLWDRVNNWSDEYPEAEVADIKYASITLIDVLSFLGYMGD